MKIGDPFGSGVLGAVDEFQRNWNSPASRLARGESDVLESVRAQFEKLDELARYGVGMAAAEAEALKLRRSADEALGLGFAARASLEAQSQIQKSLAEIAGTGLSWADVQPLPGDGLASAVAEAQRSIDRTVRLAMGHDLLDQRDHAFGVFNHSVSRTFDALVRARTEIASALSATRSFEEMAGLASSISAQADSLRYAALGTAAFPKSVADELLNEIRTAARAAEAFEEVQTEEERVALVETLLTFVAELLKRFGANTGKEVRSIGLFFLIGVLSDVNSFLSQPGLTPAQDAMLKDTHREVQTLRRDLQDYVVRQSRLDEAYVSELPQAELRRSAIIRSEPGRAGRALARAAALTPVAVAGTDGVWKRVVFRDPLSNHLAEGWVSARAVRMLGSE